MNFVMSSLFNAILIVFLIVLCVFSDHINGNPLKSEVERESDDKLSQMVPVRSYSLPEVLSLMLYMKSADTEDKISNNDALNLINSNADKLKRATADHGRHLRFGRSGSSIGTGQNWYDSREKYAAAGHLRFGK